jgi:hypothetical protein
MQSRFRLHTITAAFAATILLLGGCLSGPATVQERRQSVADAHVPGAVPGPMLGQCRLGYFQLLAGGLHQVSVPASSLTVLRGELTWTCHECGQQHPGLVLRGRGSSGSTSGGQAGSQQDAKLLGSGACVPVSADGYYLTAAHMLETPDTKATPSHLVLMAADSTGRGVTVTARVVWTTPIPEAHDEAGTIMTEVPDLAIIHAPIRPLLVATIQPPDSLTDGQPVLGGRPVAEADLTPERYPFYGGHIRDTKHIELDGVRLTSVRMIASSARGDSGGPILAADGRLIAITSGSTPWWGRRFCAGWTIDPESLQRIIQADRQRHPAAPAAAQTPVAP